MAKRVFLIVLDSFGIGGAKDANLFNDLGSNTLKSVSSDSNFYAPNLTKLGLFAIDGVEPKITDNIIGNYGRLEEKSIGKDTTIGHWEIAGCITKEPFPTYPKGFPSRIIDTFKGLTGRGVLCNKPYSGTQVIKDYGKKHIETGDLIVYTSSDSVFQIAAHESIVSVEQLYRYSEIARKLLTNEDSVARVIARPFIGEYPNFTRTSNRRDFSLAPPRNMLDILLEKNKSVISVGKIYDIFAGRGFTEEYHTTSNTDGERKIISLMDKDFEGLCFVNLVDFDMLYGHRNDISGYARAITEFDKNLKIILDKLKKDDMLIITADHGCDPATISTDHSRENTPLLIYGKNLKRAVNLKTGSFSDISATILDYFGIQNTLAGSSKLDFLS